MTDSIASAKSWHEKYFEEFLPGIMNQLLLPELSTLTACFEIAITDVDTPAWRLAIEDGRLVYVGHEGEAPVCRYALDIDTLRKVVAAKETPQEAFFDLRIALEGDMEMGLKLSTVLEPFFARYAFEG